MCVEGKQDGSEPVGSQAVEKTVLDGKLVNPQIMSKYRTRGECFGGCTRVKLHRMLPSHWESPNPEERALQHPIAGRPETSFHYWVPPEANPEAHTGTLYELCDLEKDNLSRPQFPLFRKIKECMLSLVQLPHPVTFDGRNSLLFCHLDYLSLNTVLAAHSLSRLTWLSCLLSAPSSCFTIKCEHDIDSCLLFIHIR